jgi:hypothetical protein
LELIQSSFPFRLGLKPRLISRKPYRAKKESVLTDFLCHEERIANYVPYGLSATVPDQEKIIRVSRIKALRKVQMQSPWYAPHRKLALPKNWIL